MVGTKPLYIHLCIPYNAWYISCLSHGYSWFQKPREFSTITYPNSINKLKYFIQRLKGFYFINRLKKLPQSYFCKYGRRGKWEENILGKWNTATGSCSHTYSSKGVIVTTEKNTKCTHMFILGKNVLKKIYFSFLKIKHAIIFLSQKTKMWQKIYWQLCLLDL